MALSPPSSPYATNPAPLSAHLPEMNPRAVSLWLLLAVCAWAGEPGIALAVRGTAFTGPLSLDQRGLAVGGTVLSCDDLAAAAFPSPVAVPSWMDQGAVSVKGDQLRGLPRSFAKDQLDLTSDALGPISLASAKLASIVLSPVRFTVLEALLDMNDTPCPR